MTLMEPGYCIRCGEFRLLTPIPDRRGGACHDCETQLEPGPESTRHVCNTGDRLKPGHPEYRLCSCGQWFHSAGGYWYRVNHPPVRWLRSHGLAGADEFLAYDDAEEPRPSFAEVFTAGPAGWRYLLRWLQARAGGRR